MIWQRLIRVSKRCRAAVAGVVVVVGSASIGAGEEVDVPSKSPPLSSRPLKSAKSTAAPALPPSTFNLPAAFGILNKRTIFAKNGIPAAAAGANLPAEATLAVRGIVSDERSFLVFIEDTAAHRTMQLRPGDLVAGGKVGRICLDDFSFECGGASKKICVGQNLLGAIVPAAMPAPAPPPPGAEPGAKPEPPPRNPKQPNLVEIGPDGQRGRNVPTQRAAAG
jgi:hypothetical protein